MFMDGSPTGAEPRRRRSRRRWLPIAAVPVLIAGVVVFRLTTGQSAVDVVREYLADVRDRDVDAALADVAQGPYGFNAGFLTADAISDGWRVGDVRLVAGDDHSASVAAELVAGGESTDCTFRLIRLDGDWTLVDPFVEAEFANPPVEFLQVNDQIVSLADADPQGRTVTIKLFPGRYSFFSDVPDVVSVADSPEVLAGPLMSEDGEDEPDLDVTFDAMTVSDQVVRNAGQAVNDYLDDCTEFTTSAPHECPFGVSSEEAYVDNKYLYGLRDLTWSITEYPQVRLGPSRDGANRDAPGGFVLTADDPGVATVSGTASRDGTDRDFTADCSIDLESLTARVALDGSVTVTGTNVDESNCV